MVKLKRRVQIMTAYFFFIATAFNFDRSNPGSGFALIAGIGFFVDVIILGSPDEAK